jgi:hypothetical protein
MSGQANELTKEENDDSSNMEVHIHELYKYTRDR